MKILVVLLFYSLIFFTSSSQTLFSSNRYTHADTIRGSITEARAWWDVIRYDITIRPDFLKKATAGKNRITYKVVTADHPATMQIDLQAPLHIDFITDENKKRLSFKREGNAWYVSVARQNKNAVNFVDVYFSGVPNEALNPPWEGGWSFKKDLLNRPWMTVTCQGLGASVWYPCKDHQSDEPDKGASLSIIVPDTLAGIANGQLEYRKNNGDGTATYKWSVVNPINNYNIVPYIGKYVNFSETYKGKKGTLRLNYWVMDYNKKTAQSYMPLQVRNMLTSLEHWFGPYPFYEDGYKLVEAPHLGMEHQSAIAYGNEYKHGYKQRDRSGTGWGLKFDYIIVHESGHEWFGNNITTKDIADLWVHESFTTYSETLYIESMFGKKAADDYNAGLRNGIKNAEPIISHYGVNKEATSDVYNKGSNVLHTIRTSMNDDNIFRQILTSLNKTFYHQTVTSAQVEGFISAMAKYDYSRVFHQYLRTTQIPRLEYYFTHDNQQLSYRWTNCVKGFNLPIVLKANKRVFKIIPSGEWATKALSKAELSLFNAFDISKLYYINVMEGSPSGSK